MTDRSGFGRVAVLMGGVSAERAVSLRSGEAVLSALVAAGVDAVGVDVQDDIAACLAREHFDMAFIALHGRGGEDGTIQGLLEWLRIPYTGSGVMASALGMDKWRTKLIWQAAGLPTPAAVLLGQQSDWQHVIQELGHDVIVKPAHEGSSIGMRKVHDAQALQDSYQFASQYDALVLAERWITGNEYTIALVGGQALPVIQLKTSHEFYDYEAKYESLDTEYLLPSDLSAEKEAELQQLAMTAFDLIGCQGWGRVDVMADADGQFWLLEVNTSPGMTDHSLVPMAARAVGMSFTQLVIRLLEEVKKH
ncbi:D-alanine--D-alanine ligase [Oceanobacter sp. 4_MG-2023]|jgi:D-alanine-D-alanine ligase|uniref:D-alanine--D-alanine ligase n=1 Tax=Oceanobacter sp. 4_MG-2023 TaxID=3062623 RepID=UPI00273446BA|nr:D-alanine--D-alanine ligase [Oceanobacter sp. 4_MG-2023]MDP2546434.1 D-alanine--D-alanine ligase [Oceanobacter sp. 4_MG-2023]